MTWQLLFVVGVPLLFTAVLFAMYKFRVGRTNWDAYPSPERQPSQEPSDRKKVRMIAIFSGVIYLLMLISAGPFAAAVALAALLLLDLACVLIITTIQELVFWLRGPKLDPETGAVVGRRPYHRQLLWNFFNSFEVISYLVP